jgi:hypothetical protein
MQTKELMMVKKAANLLDKVLAEVSDAAAGWLVEYIKAKLEARKAPAEGASDEPTR